MLCHEASKLESQRFDTGLAPEDGAALDEHLRDCPACCQAADGFVRLDALMSGAWTAAPTPLFAQRVMVRVQRRRRWLAILRVGVLVLLAGALATGLILLPLSSAASPAGGLASNSPVISALAGLLVRCGGLVTLLLGVGSSLRQGLLASPGYLAIAGLLAVAVAVALVWLRTVNRASLALARRTV